MEQLLEDVVEGVLKNVKRRLYVSEDPKGLEGKLRDFETTISLQQGDGKVRVIGIVGLGGVGKTTLATEFFNSQRSKYKRCCFVFDVRDKALTTLQKYLLKDLTQQDEEIRSINEGKGKLRSLLPSSDCLIILDDVDHIQQLEALLLPAKDALKTNSLILVTSRNKDVLIRSQIPETSIYRLQGLEPEHSRELFCWSAFGKPHPAVGFEEEVEKFLGACLGLPLSIKVFGSLLFGINELNQWEAVFRKISDKLPDDIQGKLRISYDALDEEEKKMFLDIACFFEGEKRDRVSRIWNRTGWEGKLGKLRVSKLANRYLVEVDSNDRLRMDNCVRDMGRYLAEKEPPDGELRLWNPTANLFHKLSGQLPVRGISLVNGNEVEQSFENLAEPVRTRLLSNMSRLQLLKVDELSRVLLPFLDSNTEFKSFTFFLKHSGNTNLSLRRTFIMYVNNAAPLQLRELCIRACVRSLVLSECSALQRLRDSIGNLTSLQTLPLARCSNLEMVPNVEHLGSLEYLNVSQCSKLRWDAGIVEQLRQRLGEGFIEERWQEEFSSDGE